MSHKITARVDGDFLEYLFQEFGVWEKIHKTALTTIKLPAQPSVTYQHGVSRILLHFTANHKHVASTHRIMEEKTGHVFHWDAKGLQIGDVWLERY